MEKQPERPHLAPGYPAGLPEPTAAKDPHPYMGEMPVEEEERAQQASERQKPKRT
ncbi:MAG: hypothetical protein ACYCW6_21715 [Candidatus Xenobia bacterium]